MTWPGVFDPGNNCSWCGHRWPHDQPCPGTITVRRGRPPVEQQVPCECQRHVLCWDCNTAKADKLDGEVR